MYKVYTTSNCPQCESLKMFVKMKQMESEFEFVIPNAFEIEHIKASGVRSFPAILNKDTNEFDSLQKVMLYMESK